MPAYYNEIDPFAAAWLRELVKAGHLADGVVDDRSIEDVTPDDLRDFEQCHFFAGIGVWSHALRGAGWPDDRPVWTGSCPCQPFSAAGKGGGFDDERHLWPAWHWLVEQCRPPVLIGEQVASKDAEPWLDLVQADLEALGYALGAVAFPSAGIGAPHIRDRTYWVAQSADQRHERTGAAWGRRDGPADSGAIERLADAVCDGARPAAGDGTSPEGASVRDDRGAAGVRATAGLSSALGRLADDDDARLEGRGQPGRERAAECPAGAGGVVGGLAYSDSAGTQRRARDASETTRLQEGERQPKHDADVSERGGADHGERDAVRGDGILGDAGQPGPVNGLWRAADWVFCRDGKWRPVEPGTFPLAHGAAARVGRLRGYGNAINAQAAETFIRAYLDAA